MFLRKVTSFKTILRNYSMVKNLVAVDIDNQTGISTILLQRPPVNSLNLELLTELSSTLTDLEKENTRGIILKSASDGIFSAGIDILELYRPKEERMVQFWSALQDVWIKLYGHSAPTVACINGHAPAGGCLLALSCEYRVMMKNKTIGLNETQLGVIAPSWFIASMENVIGRRRSEISLTTGKMYTTEEALNIGLIDEIAENSDDCVAKSKGFLKLFKNIPLLARSMTKKVIRKDTLKILVDNREADLKLFCEEIKNENMQQGLELYLKALKKQK